MDVLLVAAKKEKIADYTSVIAQAGRTPVIVDVDAFALQNAFEVNYGLEAGRSRRAAERRAPAPSTSTSCRATSRSSRATSRWAATPIPRRCRRSSTCPFESAEQLKKGIPVDGATFEEAQPVLHAVTENVLLEIQKTFDFFKASASTDQIDRIMLSGGASRVDGFHRNGAGALQRAGRGLRSVPRGDVGREEARLATRRRMAATAAVAVGLALRKVRRPMIRINLLGGERQVKKKAIAFDIGRRADGALQR